MDLALYIDPNAVSERSKENFGKIEIKVLRMAQKVIQAQQNFLKESKNPTELYICRLLQPDPLTTLIQFVQNIM